MKKLAALVVVLVALGMPGCTPSAGHHVQDFATVQKAAEQGHVGAQYNLGVMPSAGLGVQKDWLSCVNY
jgi:hypothetical protein